jgi:nucleoside-diphosphate-sugar epimerase
MVAELGSFRLLAHAAGLSPTMADARRIVEVNLVGTIGVLAALDLLVVEQSAAVCFASTAGYIPTELLGPSAAALLERTDVEEFLDRAAAAMPDPMLAYAFSKRGVQIEAAKAAVRWGPKGWLGGLVVSGNHRHTYGQAGVCRPARHAEPA